MVLGYWLAYPDYITQGKTEQELQVNLEDIAAWVRDNLHAKPQSREVMEDENE